MKKIYSAPTVVTTFITVERLIANSILSTSGATGLSVGSGGTSENSISSGNAKRNDYNVWDEDWSK